MNLGATCFDPLNISWDLSAAETPEIVLWGVSPLSFPHILLFQSSEEKLRLRDSKSSAWGHRLWGTCSKCSNFTPFWG